MKKDKIYLIIIIVLVIILLELLVFSINRFNSKQIITCTKQLTIDDVKYENKYKIYVGRNKEVSSLKMINNYGDLDNETKENLKKQLGINNNSTYKCSDKNGFVCEIESDKILNSSKNEKNYWYYTYIDSLKKDGYMCSE